MVFCYLFCTLFWEQKLQWDGVFYLSCARGIARDFDFSSRTNSVLGLLKYPFSQHNHHYLLHSIYLTAFLKLFGENINAAYFTLLIVTEKNTYFLLYLQFHFYFFTCFQRKK